MSNILIKSSKDKTTKNKKRAIIVGALLLSLFAGIIPLVFLNLTTSSTNSATPNVITTASTSNPIQIGFISKYSDEDTGKIMGQMALDSQFHLIQYDTTILTNGTLATLDALILANVSLDTAQILIISNFIQMGGNLFYFAGNDNSSASLFYTQLGFLPSGASITLEKSESAILEYSDERDPLVSGIQWSSSPESKVYMRSDQFQNIHSVIQKTGTNIPILFRANISIGHIVAYNTLLTKSDNWDSQLWPYTPYLFYRSIMWMEDREAKSYATWENSPVPHESEKIGLIFYQILLFIVGFGGFFLARRKSKIPIDEDYLKKAAEIKQKKIDELKTDDLKEDSKNKWEAVGLHRQIASFFLTLFTALLVAVPYLLLSVYIYPRFVMPFPQTQGWINWTGGFFATLFTVFDLGTGTALTKFFSEYRVHEPAKAVKYAQIFIWWQALTGCVQITIVSSVGAYVLSAGDLGHMSWFFILASLGQFPGNLGVIGMVMEAMQRFDVKVTLDTILGATLNNIVNYLTILFFRAFYANQPAYGEAFGAGIGMIVGGYLSSFGSFIIYGIFFRKMGFHVGTLFRVDFDKGNLKESLAYGFKLTLGNVWVPLTGLLEIMLIEMYIQNYNAEMGYLNMMKNITGLVAVCGSFFSASMPAMSEAHGNKKEKLTEYYIVSNIRWANFLLFFLLAAILAIGDKILLAFAGSGQWGGATKYLLPLCLFALLEPYAWLLDRIFQATHHTGYNTIVWIIEQATRALFLILILPYFKELWALYLAYIPGIFLKDLSGLILVRKKVSKFKPYWVYTFISTGISAVVVYFFLTWLATIIIPIDLIATIVLFLVGFFSSLFIYIFLIGFIGGFDDNTLAEMKRGLAMIKSVKFFFIALEKVGELGHRVCPWKNKFNVDIFELAAQEALQLTEEKRKLII